MIISNGRCFIFIPQGYNNSKGVTLEASFTPDSQFVMIGKNDHSWSCCPALNMNDILALAGEVCTYLVVASYRYSSNLSDVFVYPHTSGSEDGKIHVWNAESGMKVALLDGKHTGPITCLQFNPKFMTFASACSNMVSWGCRLKSHWSCIILFNNLAYFFF